MWKKKISVISLAAMLMLSACSSTVSSNQTQPGTGTSAGMESSAESENPAADTNNTGGEGTGQQPVPESGSLMDTDEKDWTVLWYLCGTDLETKCGSASQNLEGLSQVKESDRVNFVIQTGGTKQWYTDGIETDALQRFTMNGGELTEVETLPLANMADPETLGDFLSWGVENYPARKYMVIFWDHGGGPLGGAVVDELYDRSCLGVPELAKGLSAADVKFDVIGFDACLMASLEVADAMSPYGSYLVASEEAEPGSGWDYAGFGSYLVENPECDGVQLGKQICDTYLTYNSGSAFAAGLLTLSVVDLGKITPLTQAFGEAVTEMGSFIQDTPAYTNLSLELDRAEKYFTGSNTIDISDMVQKAESLNPETAQKVLTAVSDAVIYSIHGDTRLHSNGLSVMYALNLKPGTYDMYSSICPSPEYLAYLDALNYTWRAPDWVYEKTEPVAEPDRESYHIDISLELDEAGRWVLQADSGVDAVKRVVYKLFRFDTKDNRAYCLGDAADIGADWENGVFWEEFDGKWASIDGKYCYMHEIDDQEEYILYSIPVRFEGADMDLRAAYVYDGQGGGNYELYGLWNQSNTGSGIPSRDTVALEDGMELTLLFPETDSGMSELLQYREGDTVVYHSASTSMKKIQIKDGTYAMRYELEDSLGRKQVSEPLSVICKNGDIVEKEIME